MKRAYPAVDSVDFGDAILSPLLDNAHTHLELTDYSNWDQQQPVDNNSGSFVDWIIRLIAVKRHLTIEDYRVSLQHGVDRSLAAGTGVVGDILSQFELHDLYTSGAVKGSVFLETLGQSPEMIAAVSEKLHHVLEEKTCGDATFGVAPHSPYTLSADYLSKIYRWCRENHCRCTTHLAESPEEVQFIMDAEGELAEKLYPHVGWQEYLPRPSGLRPTEYLGKQGGLFPGNLLVHGVQLTDAEIELLTDNAMSLVLCPRSNAQLDVGKAPAGKLHRSGIKLALGTDSLASCESLSIWDEMAFAHRWFDGELDAPTLYRMATLGGAEVLGLGNRVGSLENGKTADFQVLQPKALPHKSEIFDYFVSPGCTEDIVRVYHQGQLKV
jgi:cytosine/adenosine deaminase-related metal-dependent hydrolase